MATSRWTEELLDEASDQGDDPKARPNADQLAEKVMTSEGGVRSYNHLLEVADTVLASPSLVLNRDSALYKHLAEFPGEALEYFQPAPAPDWLDEDKLRLGASLWANNSVAATGVLYALSLPCAYLYKAGVPALYETGKLGEHKYVFQRIYETGMFVDAVMDDDGIEVLEDYVPDQNHLYLEVLRELDPGGDWTQEGRGSLVRAAAGSDQPNLQERVEAEVEKRSQPRRYLWGRGLPGRAQGAVPPRVDPLHADEPGQDEVPRRGSGEGRRAPDAHRPDWRRPLRRGTERPTRSRSTRRSWRWCSSPSGTSSPSGSSAGAAGSAGRRRRPSCTCGR